MDCSTPDCGLPATVQPVVRGWAHGSLSQDDLDNGTRPDKADYEEVFAPLCNKCAEALSFPQAIRDTPPDGVDPATMRLTVVGIENPS